jgi:hypothetical protein
MSFRNLRDRRRVLWDATDGEGAMVLVFIILSLSEHREGQVCGSGG